MNPLPLAVVELPADRSAARLRFEGGDLARSDDPERIVWTSGHLRQPDGAPVGAGQLLERGWVSTDDVETDRFTGNGLVLCVSPAAAGGPRFLAYSTLFSMPQLYLAPTAGGGVLLSTDLRALIERLDHVEIDEQALPLHFLFRFVPGRGTYLRGVERLYPGERWRGAASSPLERRRRVDLRFPELGERRIERPSEDDLATLDHRSSRVVGAYLGACRTAGRPAGNLLSGGIDSSLLQSWIADHRIAGRDEARSFGFAVPEAPSFGFETDYARDASRRLGTAHTFVEIRRDDYPELLRRSIRAILQPTLFNEGWACHVALGERLGAEGWTLFAGNGADAVHGILDLVEGERARRLRRWPGLCALLGAAAPLLRRFSALEPWLDAARLEDDPATLRSPSDRVSIAGELEDGVRAFGPEAVRRAFDLRRALGAELLATDDPHERLQVLDLVTAGYDPTVAVTQIYAAYGVEVVQPYLDEDLVRAAFAFAPAARFFAGRRPEPGGLKPLQRRLLQRRGFGDLAAKRKGGTTFYREVWSWMAGGVLRPLVDEIERPAFLSRAHFDRLVRRPGDFLWNLLVYDVFRRELAAARLRREP